MTNAPIPLIPPLGDGDGVEDSHDTLEADGGALDSAGEDLSGDPLDTREDEPLDPDVDADRVDSADADARAASEGTKDGDLQS